MNKKDYNKINLTPDVITRFKRKTDTKISNKFYKKSRCHMWTGTKNQLGYGVLGMNDQSHLAHRLSYVINKGKFDQRLDIHHKCHNRPCVNPAHLVPITHKENLAKSNGVSSTINKKKKKCPRGHRFSKSNNSFVNNAGSRVCIICAALYHKRENKITKYIKSIPNSTHQKQIRINMRQEFPLTA